MAGQAVLQPLLQRPGTEGDFGTLPDNGVSAVTRQETPRDAKKRDYGSEGWEFESLRARNESVWFRLMRDILASAVG